MKKFLILLVMIGVCFFANAQITEKKNFASGTLTVITGEKISFTNLTWQGDKAVFTNAQTYLQESLYDVNIASIEGTESTLPEEKNLADQPDENPSITQEKPKQNLNPKPQLPLLTIISVNKVEVNGVRQSREQISQILGNYPDLLEQYKKGKTASNVGLYMIGGGLACAITCGIINLVSSNDSGIHYNSMGFPYYQDKKKGVGPAGIIAGGGVAAAGLVVHLIGHSNAKNALESYNKRASREVSLISNGNGLGIALKF